MGPGPPPGGLGFDPEPDEEPDPSGKIIGGMKKGGAPPRAIVAGDTADDSEPSIGPEEGRSSAVSSSEGRGSKGDVFCIATSEIRFPHRVLAKWTPSVMSSSPFVRLISRLVQ